LELADANKSSGKNRRVDENRLSASGSSTHQRRKSQFGLNTMIGGPNDLPSDFLFKSAIIVPEAKSILNEMKLF